MRPEAGALRAGHEGAHLRRGKAGEAAGELYAYFLQALDRALNETAQSLPPQATPEDLPRLALDLALRSYASQLACARILDILQPPCEEAPKKAKK